MRAGEKGVISSKRIGERYVDRWLLGGGSRREVRRDLLRGTLMVRVIYHTVGRPREGELRMAIHGGFWSEEESS